MKTLALALLFSTSIASAATVTLQRGQTGTLADQKITVISVQDNRCPVNARCIREGELIAKVLVKQNGKLHFLTLQFPEAPNTAWAGLRIQGASDNLTSSRAPVQITFTDVKMN